MSLESYLLDRLKPNDNTLRELTRLAHEICRRDGIDWEELFGGERMRSVLAPETNLGPKDRQKKLRKLLEERRFPETAAIEAEIENCRKQIARDCATAVNYPLDLEGDELSVTIDFSSPSELAERVRRLEEAAAHPALERLFQILKGQA